MPNSRLSVPAITRKHRECGMKANLSPERPRYRARLLRHLKDQAQKSGEYTPRTSRTHPTLTKNSSIFLMVMQRKLIACGKRAKRWRTLQEMMDMTMDRREIMHMERRKRTLHRSALG